MPAPRNIDDAIIEVEVAKVNALAIERRPDDDTAIILLPPPKAPEQSNELYSCIQLRYATPMYGKSKVFEQQAPMFYEKNFNLNRQTKLRRRFSGLLSKLGLLDIKYVLNCTPVTEGDEAVQSVLELNCPLGILMWGYSAKRFGCAARYVCGVDTIERLQGPQPYFQMRHHLGIERLMLALHGWDPNFDSAVKVYTTAMLAKQFNVTGSRVQDNVVTWIRNPDNGAFIEVLPEASLAMADSLQSGALALDAFAILLGENLLEKDVGIEQTPGATIHGRPRYDISEEWQSRIQYATQSMESRVKDHFDYMTNMEMTWINQLPQYQKLFLARDVAARCGCLDALEGALVKMKQFVRSLLLECLCLNVQSLPPMGFDTGEASDEADQLHPLIDYKYVWAQLPTEKRIFTRIYWQLLGEMKVDHFWLSWQQPNEVRFFQDFHMTSDGVDIAKVMSRYKAERHISIGSIESMLQTVKKALQLLPATSLGNPIPDHMATKVLKTDFMDDEQTRLALWTSAEFAQAFEFGDFLKEVRGRIRGFAEKMLQTPQEGNLERSEVRISNVLLCTTDAENRFLPLWAGGNDDGTGGVFNTEIPFANENESFTTHGPSIRVGDDSLDQSEYSFAGSNSDAPTSAIVHDGYSDTLNRHRVYAASEVASEIDDMWTDVIAYRDQRALAEFDSTNREDEVASVGSQATEILQTKNEASAARTDAERAIDTADGFKDYSSIFNSDEDMNDEDISDNEDQEFIDDDDDDEDPEIIDKEIEDDEDMDIIEASEATEKPTDIASAVEHPGGNQDSNDERIVTYKRDIDQELMDRP